MGPRQRPACLRMMLTTPSQIRELLARVRTVAMVGASSNPLRPSYTVFSYLRTQTPYDATPINPTLTEIDGIAAYPSLAAYAEHAARRTSWTSSANQAKSSASSTTQSPPAQRPSGSNTASSTTRRSRLPTRRARRRRGPLHKGRARALSRRPFDEWTQQRFDYISTSRAVKATT